MVSFEKPDIAYTNIIADLQKLDIQAKKLQSAAEEKKKAEASKNVEEEIGLRLKEAKAEAEKIIKQAEEQARALVEDSEAKADEIMQNAFKQGYEEGADKAEGEIRVRCEEETKALRNLISQFEKARENMIDELEGDIISLIMETSKKVINIELEKDDKVFEGLIRNALTTIKREGKIVIRVSQDEYSRFFMDGKFEFVLNDELIKATVIEEPMFEKGDCVVESDGETVNAGIRSQLKCIELAFRSGESHIA
jgi:flagellar assembly protein FliH